MVLKHINREVPWVYFDGTLGGDSTRCGGGAVIYFNDHNSLHIQAGFGNGSNNYAELMALRMLLTKAWEWGSQSLQVFWDSKIILEWAKGTQNYNILRLRPLLEEVKHLTFLFDLISFVHVCRERNTVVDRLSKAGAQLQEGEEKTKCFLRDPRVFYHRPYREPQPRGRDQDEP